MTENLIENIINKIQNINYEIVIIDNSSLDSQKINLDFKDKENLRIIFANNNGFGAACNQGAKVAAGKLLLFINSDVVFENDVISPCVNYMNSNLKVGVLGCKLISKDGMLDHGCKRGFPTPQASLCYYLKLDKKYPTSKKYGAYRLTYLDNDEINEVDSVSGAFLMIRKNIFDEISGFDEEFFMYGEDLDLCFRVKQNNYKVIYFPDVVVTHLKGQSGLNTKSKTVLYHFYKAMIIFYKKHYKRKYNVFVTWLVYGAVWGKYFFDLILSKLKILRK